MEKLLTALEMEKDVESIVKKVKNQIYEDLNNAEPLEGVKRMNSSVSCASVSFSALTKKNLILSPEYYLPDSQANAVKRKLDLCRTASDLLRALSEMVSLEKCEVGKNFSARLNPNTISVLKQYL